MTEVWKTLERQEVYNREHDIIHHNSQEHMGEFGSKSYIVPQNDYDTMKSALGVLMGDSVWIIQNEWQAKLMFGMAKDYLQSLEN